MRFPLAREEEIETDVVPPIRLAIRLLRVVQAVLDHGDDAQRREPCGDRDGGLPVVHEAPRPRIHQGHERPAAEPLRQHDRERFTSNGRITRAVAEILRVALETP